MSPYRFVMLGLSNISGDPSGLLLMNALYTLKGRHVLEQGPLALTLTDNAATMELNHATISFGLLYAMLAAM